MFTTRKIIRTQREKDAAFENVLSTIEEMTKGSGKNKKVSGTPDEMHKILTKVFEIGFKNGQKYQENTSFITDFYGDYDKIDDIAETLLDEDMIDEDVYDYITSLRVDDLILILSEEDNDFNAAEKSESARLTFGEGEEVDEILDSVKHDFATAMENAYRIEQGEDLEDDEEDPEPSVEDHEENDVVEEETEDDIIEDEEEDDEEDDEEEDDEEDEPTPSRTRSRGRKIEIEDDDEDYDDEDDYDDEEYDD